MRAHLFTSLCLLLLAPSAFSAGPDLDAGYFTDAASLRPGPGLSGTLNVERLPYEKQAFCARSEYDVADSLNNDLRSRLAFQNPGGMFNAGLCWWHTRFQRAAAYLALYRPELSRPTHAQAVKLIERIISMSSVVEIPGYANLETFSRDYKAEITARIDAWQLRDIANGTWFSRLPDAGRTTAARLRGMMDALYEREFAQPRLTVLRIHKYKDGPGYSHALLLTSIEAIRAEPLPNNPLTAFAPAGYRLKVIDSNDPQEILTIEYRFGDRSLHYCLTYGYCADILAYTAWDDELAGMEKVVSGFCAR